MTRTSIARGAFAAAVVLLAVAAGYLALERDVDPAAPTSPATAPKSPATTPSTAPAAAHPGFLYGRITTDGGTTYEGRLRWGGDQEAFWGDYFNGAKDENPWVAHVPPQRLPKERLPCRTGEVTVTVTPGSGWPSDVTVPKRVPVVDCAASAAAHSAIAIRRKLRKAKRMSTSAG